MMQPRFFSHRVSLGQSIRLGCIATLILILLAKGGTPYGASEFLAIPVGLCVALAALEVERNDQIARLRNQTLVFVGVLVSYVVFQSLPLGIWENPIWATVAPVLGLSERGTISVAPAQSLWALMPLLLPYFMFLAGLSLFQFDFSCEWLWRGIAWLGTAFAIYGIVQLLLFPDWLLYTQKKVYLGDLTGSLVNRNSAATFLGICVVVTVCLIRWNMRRDNPDRNQKPLVVLWGVELNRRLAVLGACAAVQILALGMTGSRGGLLATTAGLLVAVKLLNFSFLKGERRNRIATWVLLAVAALAAFQMFAGRTLERMENAGSNSRLCAFQSAADAARVNLPFGTGLGTFEDIFPAFRDPACGIAGVWDVAHNSYLENLVELGLPYLLFLAVGFAVVVRGLRQGLRLRKSRRPFVVGGIAVSVLVGVHALVDFSLQIPAVSSLYAMVLASSLAVSLGRRQGNHS